MDTKQFFLSKTFWFNVLALIVLVSNGFGFANFEADPALDQYALVAITVINVILRLVTKTAIAK